MAQIKAVLPKPERDEEALYLIKNVLEEVELMERMARLIAPMSERRISIRRGRVVVSTRLKTRSKR